ncbi:hypothetical protein [Tellurirhabdus bombi]|uniref:hypothetical protein n=1 Tax=Tellurirhabdus bombi TaxID=2907205 RepID=UPI001F1E8839|nr:hypothetical protein [Tellurirhabdus bombi]
MSDVAITVDAVKQAIASNPELQGQLFETFEPDFTTYLTGTKKMIVASETDFAADRQKLINDTTKAMHEKWETVLQPVLGKKPDGPNVLAWADQTFKTKKLIASDSDGPDGQVKNQQIDQLTQEVNKLKTSLEEKDKAVFGAKVNSSVTSAIDSLNFPVPAHLAKDEKAKAAFLKDQKAAAKALFGGLYTPEEMKDGAVVFKDSEGNVLADNGTPLTAAQIFEKNHSHMLAPKGRQQNGTGSADDANHSESPDYKGATEDEIIDKLAEEKLAAGSMAWQEAYKKAMAAAGIPIK